MQDDERCCGSGTCIINDDGLCWCGQRWDGQRLCTPDDQPPPAEAPTQEAGDDSDA